MILTIPNSVGVIDGKPRASGDDPHTAPLGFPTPS